MCVYIYIHIRHVKILWQLFWFHQQLSLNIHGSWGLNSPLSATCSERALCRTQLTMAFRSGRLVARSECMKPVAHLFSQKNCFFEYHCRSLWLLYNVLQGFDTDVLSNSATGTDVVSPESWVHHNHCTLLARVHKKSGWIPQVHP